MKMHPYMHQGLKPWPEASQNQSPGPRPCEILVTALAAWARLGRLRALRLSLHNTMPVVDKWLKPVKS